VTRSDGLGFLDQEEGLAFLEDAGVRGHDFVVSLADGKDGDFKLEGAFVHYTLVPFSNEYLLKQIELHNKFLRNWSQAIS
jgi:hypothetical protein